MSNVDIREKVRTKGLKLWQIAAELGITDSTFSRKLRKELTEEEKSRILSIIDRLSAEAKETA